MIVIIIIVYFCILYISICMVLLNPMLHGITIFLLYINDTERNTNVL